MMNFDTEDPRAGWVNPHCHLLNFDCVPDAWIRTRAPIREALLRRRYVAFLARVITWLAPGKKYNRLHEMFALFRMPISGVSARYYMEMGEAQIALATPLMIDMGMCSFGDIAEIPYPQQIDIMKEIASNYYGEIMPFVCFDPRRKNAVDIVKQAVMKKGFLGIKLYPALGWDPRPDPTVQPVYYGHELICEALEELYAFAQTNEIPLTVHCSPGGAYSDQLMFRPQARARLSNPKNWDEVLKEYPDLRLNLAHFGQDLHINGEWSATINWLCMMYPHVYTDLAYNDAVCDSDFQSEYFRHLHQLSPDVLKKVIWATDWPMTRHTWTEAEWKEPFILNTSLDLIDDIFRDNALRFLFSRLKMPPRIKTALQKKDADIPIFLKYHLKRLGGANGNTNSLSNQTESNQTDA